MYTIYLRYKYDVCIKIYYFVRSQSHDLHVKMAELIAVPLKKPSDVDVIKPLTNIIKSTYNNANDQKDYTEAIADFSKLRNNALWRAFEKYESSLEVIYRYDSSLIIILILIMTVH